MKLNCQNEIEEDYMLLQEANERLKRNGATPTIPLSEVMSELGISDDDLADIEDIIIE